MHTSCATSSYLPVGLSRAIVPGTFLSGADFQRRPARSKEIPLGRIATERNGHIICGTGRDMIARPRQQLGPDRVKRLIGLEFGPERPKFGQRRLKGAKLGSPPKAG